MDPDFPGGPEQPADRPEKYPQEILWTLADAQADRNVFTATQTNLSRPPMEKALRNEDGTMISHASWDVIRLSAKTAIGIHLRHLKANQSKKSYFRTNHTKEWNNAIAFLEVARPLVGMCAGHWKAEHIIGGILTGERTSTRRAAGKEAEKEAQKEAQKKSQHDSDGEDFGKDIFGDSDDDDNDNDNDSMNFKGKKRSAPRPTTKAKRPKVQRELEPAARVKELPTNITPKTQQQMKSLATEMEAQHPVAQLKKKAQSKPLDIIYISYLHQRYQLHLLKAS